MGICMILGVNPESFLGSLASKPLGFHGICMILEPNPNPGGLEDQDPNSSISKITFVSLIRGFCGQLSHPLSFYLDVDRS